MENFFVVAIFFILNTEHILGEKYGFNESMPIKYIGKYLVPMDTKLDLCDNPIPAGVKLYTKHYFLSKIKTNLNEADAACKDTLGHGAKLLQVETVEESQVVARFLDIDYDHSVFWGIHEGDGNSSVKREGKREFLCELTEEYQFKRIYINSTKTGDSECIFVSTARATYSENKLRCEQIPGAKGALAEIDAFTAPVFAVALSAVHSDENPTDFSVFTNCCVNSNEYCSRDGSRIPVPNGTKPCVESNGTLAPNSGAVTLSLTAGSSAYGVQGLSINVSAQDNPAGAVCKIQA